MVGCRKQIWRSLAVLALWAPALTGCQTFDCSPPKIDPSGNRLFLAHDPKPPKFKPDPGPPSTLSNQAGVAVTPNRVVAPVGSEVVLKAAVCGPDGRTTRNQRVEWTVAPGSVGYIVTVGDYHGTVDQLCGYLTGGTSANKVSSNYAVNSTSTGDYCLNRGTPTKDDDVPVLAGQAWITVTSPVEGQSIVTAVAPKVYGWDQRQRSSVIEWLDAKWDFPPPSVNPVGARHTFTTSIVRHTNGAPLAGWRVRYEILDGPAAGFAPDGAQIVEVPTDALGQASIEMFQVQPAEGTNRVNVQVIRSPELSRDGTRLIVANATTQKIWGASELYVRTSGPTQAAVGATLNYKVEVRNAGSHTIRQAVASLPLPQGTSLLSTNPVASVTGSNLTWALGDLAPGQIRPLEVSLRADRFGTVNACVTVQTGEGKNAQDCATTTVVAPALAVVVTADPEQAPVGTVVTFTATVTNRGTAAATDVRIVELYDSGLRHNQTAANPIEAPVGTLQPGESKTISAKFIVMAPGQLCNTVDVISGNGLRAQGRGCVTGVPSASPAPIAPVPTTPTDPSLKPVLDIKKVGPTRRNVGDQAQFDILVSNTGRAKATNLKITDNSDLSLMAVEASNGHVDVGRDLQWTIDELPPGKGMKLSVTYRCTAPADNACSRNTVVCTEGVRADTQACVSIQPSQTPLSVTIDDGGDPRAVGSSIGYTVRVTNVSQVADARVQLAVTLSPELIPAPLGTSGPTNGQIANQTVQFEPLAQLAPQQTVVYRIQARAAKAGVARLQAQITSQNMAQPLVAEEPTTVQ
ncbi:MAG: DUF11 domain-containing protein [Planctomycetes bacterium]|nr:DUF11 domain-containing protein [Planctomycetota bacterium]